MKLRHFLLGAGVGLCAAIAVKKYAMKPYISSEKALRIVKAAFKQRGDRRIMDLHRARALPGKRRNHPGIQNRRDTFGIRRTGAI